MPPPETLVTNNNEHDNYPDTGGINDPVSTLRCTFTTKFEFRVRINATRLGHSLMEPTNLSAPIWTGGEYGADVKANLQRKLEDDAGPVVNDLYLDIMRAKD